MAAALNPAAYVHTLGCPKNEVDSRYLQRELTLRGVALSPTPDDAGVIVINTCGFIKQAKEESLDAIVGAATQYPDRRLVVVGCLVQRYRSELAAEIPEVDAWFGVQETTRAADYVASLLAPGELSPTPAPADISLSRPGIEAQGAWGYVKIADGCSHTCSFCAIPQIKGPYRSESLESVLAQADDLLAAGKRELVLVGQDTTLWRDGALDLADLLKQLTRDERVQRLRIMYLHPEHLGDRLLKAMAENPRVCPYLDLPLQHASERILRAMHRGGSAAQFLELIARARSFMPHVSLRSTFIVGFPGESDSDFEELLDFCVRAQFDHAGVFAFSPEEGTRAAHIRPRVPGRLLRRRLSELSGLLLDTALEKLNRQLGERIQVMVDAVDTEDLPEGVRAVGRTPGQAPEVDGVIYLTCPSKARLTRGEVVQAVVSEVIGYDLVAEVCP